MFVSTYIGFIVGAVLVSGGLGYYIANRGTAGVKIDLDNVKADLERVKALIVPKVVTPVIPVVTPVVAS